MRDAVARDKRWSDRFLPEIKLIIGTHLIGEAPEEIDQKQATDLVVLGLRDVTVGCRVRRHYVIERGWGSQFTIRFDRPTGASTELEKIMAGWGSHFFYGISDQHEVFLRRWLLADLDVFRRVYPDLCEQRPPHGGLVVPNKDSRGLAFEAAWMPRDFFIATHRTARYAHCMDLFAVNE